MIERATGLILRTHPLTESSLIIRWLTAEFGRMSVVAKGARRPKSPFRGKLDLFYEAEFSFQRSRRSELHALREAKVHETHAALRTDLGHLRQAAYGAALIEQTTEKETPLPEIFGLMKNFLAALTEHPAQPKFIFSFELKLLRELGLSPDVAQSNLTPGAKQIAEKITAVNFDSLAHFELSEAQTRELRQFLHGFLIFHLGRIPPGRSQALGPAEAGPK